VKGEEFRYQILAKGGGGHLWSGYVPENYLKEKEFFEGKPPTGAEREGT